MIIEKIRVEYDCKIGKLWLQLERIWQGALTIIYLIVDENV